MKKAPWILLVIITTTASGLTLRKAAAHASNDSCRIVDVTISKAGEVDYVDGMRVPEDVGPLDFLRRQEKSSPCTCLLVFVPLAAKIEEIEGFRVIAGKIGYEGFHVYLYEQRNRTLVREILYGPPINPDELRSGPHGPLPWPDPQTGEN